MNHEQGLPIFYFIDFSKLVKQSKFAIKNFFKCFELGIICRKAPKVVPECPAFKVMEVGEWRWVQAARLRQEGGSSTRCSSRARSFLQALALGTGCPALHPIDLRAGLAVQHRGEGSLGSRHPISVEKITRRFPSEKRLARGTRIWTRAARAPTGGVRGGDLAPAAAAGRAGIPPPPSSRFAASEAKAARSPARGGGARRAGAALQVGAARASPRPQRWHLGRRPFAGGCFPDFSDPARAGPVCGSAPLPSTLTVRPGGRQHSPHFAKRERRPRGEEPGPGRQASPGRPAP